MDYFHVITLNANRNTYDRKTAANYLKGAPHLKHPHLFDLYNNLINDVFFYAKRITYQPQVLDLGSGEGTATISFLRLGAQVTAVDISESQLELLRKKCTKFKDNLEIICDDVMNFIERQIKKFDIVVTNSFLHHIPDYQSLIKKTLMFLKPTSQFFSFQDPLRYDSLNRFDYYFSNFAYFSWRIFQGNLSRGIKTRIRRIIGILNGIIYGQSNVYSAVILGAMVGKCVNKNGKVQRKWMASEELQINNIMTQ